MHQFQPLDITMFQTGPLQHDMNSWMLITAAKGDKVNTMTASWGGVAFLWNKYCVIIYVRESRYTKEFLDASDEFSLNYMDVKKYHGLKKYMGSVSGRDEDKIKGARLNVNYDDSIPYFDEAATVVLGKVLYKQTFDEEGLIDASIKDEFYKDGNYHTMYIAEVAKVMAR